MLQLRLNPDRRSGKARQLGVGLRQHGHLVQRATKRLQRVANQGPSGELNRCLRAAHPLPKSTRQHHPDGLCRVPGAGRLAGCLPHRTYPTVPREADGSHIRAVAERASPRINRMEGSTEVRSWLRCYRCWSQNLEVQVHYEGIHKIDAETGERGEVVDEMQEAVIQCLECMHDQPHLGFHNGRVEPIEDRWERMIAGTPWVASCTVTVDSDDVETCSGPEAGDALSYAAFGDHGTREFFTHVRFHKHDDDRIVVHLLVELYFFYAAATTEVLEDASRGTLAITSLAEESRPPASTGDAPH